MESNRPVPFRGPYPSHTPAFAHPPLTSHPCLQCPCRLAPSLPRAPAPSAPRPHLEAEAQRDDVGVHHGGEQVALGAHVLGVVALQDALLAHHLHGVDGARGFVHHLWEGEGVGCMTSTPVQMQVRAEKKS